MGFYNALIWSKRRNLLAKFKKLIRFEYLDPLKMSINLCSAQKTEFKI